VLEKLFGPKSIAVIGASRQEGKVGHSVLKNLLQYGYKGKLYPINPKAEEILGKGAKKRTLLLSQSPVQLTVEER